MTGYDLIGDIHGYTDKAENLLKKLGYLYKNGAYRHSQRQVIFLGDFIDRGPRQKDIINIIRNMIDAGSGLAIMGNHEFNAICYATKSENGEYIRKHENHNNKQHREFLNEYNFGSDEHKEAINWFKTIPVFLDLPKLGAIHACWCDDSIKKLKAHLTANNTIKEDAYPLYSNKSSEFYKRIEILLKGPEQKLPKDCQFKDKNSIFRRKARIRWWIENSKNNIDKLDFCGRELEKKQKSSIEKISIKNNHKKTDKIVFFGHYWLNGIPAPLNKKVACLDYSVGTGGKLVAYRWDGEDEILEDNFCWCD